MHWLKLTLSAPPEQADTLTAKLWELGSKGAQEVESEESVHLMSFFEGENQLPASAVSPGSGYWEALGASLVGIETLADEDWMASYRETVKPFFLGRGFQVDPREPESEGADPVGARHLLRLPAREAFGTGSHDSTRLVVEWLEEMDLLGLRVLDVGTGTGILGFVALTLGAESVVGVEIDKAAARMAASNQRLNEMRFPVIAGSVDAIGTERSFDLILVNVLPENIDESLPRLPKLLAPEGRVVFSGIVESGASRFERRLGQVGLAVTGRRRLAEWESFFAEAARR